MIISLIAAMDENRGIGKNGAIPWRLSDDLKRFKALTMGRHLIMGRKTYQAIGRPLPGRISIVITRSRSYQAPGIQVVHSLGKALDFAKNAGESEVFIIGGGEIYAQALPLADRIYLTRVHARLDCDTFFPEIDPPKWQAIEETFSPAGENNQYDSTYQLLVRRFDQQ